MLNNKTILDLLNKRQEFKLRAKECQAKILQELEKSYKRDREVIVIEDDEETQVKIETKVQIQEDYQQSWNQIQDSWENEANQHSPNYFHNLEERSPNYRNKK